MPTPPDLTEPLSFVLPDEPALPGRRVPRCKPAPWVPTADISLPKQRTALCEFVRRNVLPEPIARLS